MIKTRKIKKFNPMITYLIIIVVTILISGFLSLLDTQATYNKIDMATGEYEFVTESVESLFSLSGLKYIFTSTVSNFAAFAPLVNLIILLLGIGIMEKSGFLKTVFTMLTKKVPKRVVTFTLILLAILSSLGGDLGYVILIPLGALLFLHGKRSPIIGIIAAFAGLTCGSGLNIALSAVESTMLSSTLLGASLIDPKYSLGIWAFVFIMVIATVLIALLLTQITEKLIAPKVPKYNFEIDDETIEEPIDVGKREKTGAKFALISGLIYLAIFIYSIIPNDIYNFPGCGHLLDYSQTLYIDRLFSMNSFFTLGFVFIITLLFVIWGVFYGIGAKTIKSTNEVATHLGHSLDGIGKPIALIFFAATFISVFKKTNIGNVVVAALSNIFTNVTFEGIPLIILLFIVAAVATLFLPSSVSKWAIISGVAVPIFMNAGLSPEFAQVIFRFGETMTMGLTPVLAYFVIYLAYLQKYNQEEHPITLFKSLRYQMPYSLATGIILLLLLILWFITGLPIGVGGSPVI